MQNSQNKDTMRLGTEMGYLYGRVCGTTSGNNFFLRIIERTQTRVTVCSWVLATLSAASSSLSTAEIAYKIYLGEYTQYMATGKVR